VWALEATQSQKANIDSRRRILDFITKNPGSSKRNVEDNVTGKGKTLRDEVDALNEEGLLRKEDGRFWAA
jgi:predicted transcriptional regulator